MTHPRTLAQLAVSSSLDVSLEHAVGHLERGRRCRNGHLIQCLSSARQSDIHASGCRNNQGLIPNIRGPY